MISSILSLLEDQGVRFTLIHCRALLNDYQSCGAIGYFLPDHSNSLKKLIQTYLVSTDIGMNIRVADELEIHIEPSTIVPGKLVPV